MFGPLSSCFQARCGLLATGEMDQAIIWKCVMQCGSQTGLVVVCSRFYLPWSWTWMGLHLGFTAMLVLPQTRGYGLQNATKMLTLQESV